MKLGLGAMHQSSGMRGHRGSQQTVGDSGSVALSMSPLQGLAVSMS